MQHSQTQLLHLHCKTRAMFFKKSNHLHFLFRQQTNEPSLSMSSPIFQWFGPIFLTWYLGQETVDVAAPRLLKVQSHSVNTRQDSCIRGKRPPPLGRSSGTCAQAEEELLGPCLCGQSHASTHTHAHTPSHKLQHSLLLTQGSRWASASAAGPPCGVSTGSPRRMPSGPSAVLSASFPPEGNVREKGKRSNSKQASVRGTTPAGSWRVFQMLHCPAMTCTPSTFSCHSTFAQTTPHARLPCLGHNTMPFLSSN